MARELVSVIENKRTNLLINGAFDFWQRATSDSGASSLASNFESYVGPDRFSIVRTGSGSANDAWARSTDVPNTDFQYSLSVTRGISTGTDLLNIAQKIEANNIRHLANKKCSISFWAKASANIDTLSVDLSYADVEDTYPGTTIFFDQDIGTQIVTDTWTLYKIEDITLNANVVNGLRVKISSGNSTGTGDITLLVTGIMLNDGSAAAPFDRAGEDFGEELQFCQRYYEVIPDTRWRATLATGSAEFQHVFQTPKRAIPTIVNTTGSNITFLVESIHSARVTITASAANGSFDVDAEL